MRTPADFAGLKISVQPSKIQRDTILAFGGIPTVIEFNALYTSVQAGLMDGGRTSPAGLVDSKLYQVVKYMTLTNRYRVLS